ncbi:DUF481 domain-containing protein [Wenzhouxiangella limi]|uniref:DUF481 domain-containing protein n=1 Tax=Wenzhouxiangella limi TaxID=2707351 RepID=A0A845V2H4_9GAMM|nr:DUF481 domain-containing protein [Wenzhouxiangella limi]NDY96802.1 DUF481 domain-containing protein [Wenzhouxiangella limi]
MRALSPISVHAFLVATLLFGAVVPVYGDVLLMNNGDRITGEIKRVWDEELFIESDYADEFAVALDAVSRIESDTAFEIELRDHSVIVGRFATAESGEMVLVDDEGSRPFAPTDIEELRKIDEDFEWSARSDLAFDASHGNSQTSDFLWQAAGRLQIGDHRHTLDFRLDRDEQDGTVTKEQSIVTYMYSWFFSDQWFLSAGASYERDPVRELDYRYTPGAGIGFQFFDDASRFLETSVSFLGVREKLGDIASSSTTGRTAGRWDLRYRRRILDGDLAFFHNQRLLVYLTGRTNKLADTSTGIRWDVWGDIYLNAQIDWNWESEPAAGKAQEDVTYALGLGIELD